MLKVALQPTLLLQDLQERLQAEETESREAVAAVEAGWRPLADRRVPQELHGDILKQQAASKAIDHSKNQLIAQVVAACQSSTKAAPELRRLLYNGASNLH